LYSQNYYRRRQTKNNKAGIYKNIFTAFLLLVLIFFLIFSVDYLIHRGKNYSNVFALEHNIGKLNKTQTENALSPIVEELLHRSIQIKHDDYAITIVPREDLGASIDLDKLIDKAYAICRQGSVWQRIADRISLIRRAKIVTPYFDFNNSDYDDLINILKTEIEQPTRDAELKVDRIIPSQIGIEIQKQELYEEINRNLLHAANADTTDVIVEVPVKREYPEISTDKLLAQLGINQEISSFKTSLQGKESNTLFNIKKASDDINGIILKPGDNFLFNQLVGPAEKEDGYKESTIIVNGQYTNGYGGGVCQVSTTLYNAVLLANLQIIERYNHSIYGEATNYVPLGRDAAIFYGFKDLRFKNSLDQTIVIFSETKEGNLITTVYGERVLDKEITIITRDEEIHDFDIIEIKRQNMEYIKDRVLQEGIPGYTVKTYRVIADSRGESMEFISNDKYLSVPMKVIVD